MWLYYTEVFHEICSFSCNLGGNCVGNTNDEGVVGDDTVNPYSAGTDYIPFFLHFLSEYCKSAFT